jgi:hypothetical protein
MSIERKRGALSNEERDFITNHHATLSLTELCDAMNRNKEPILRYMSENNLRHIELTMSEDERRKVKIKKIVEKKYWFKGIQQQLISTNDYDETEVFLNKFVDMYVQFKEDVLPLEEEQMKELILLTINMDRIRIEEAKNQKRIKHLEDKIEQEYEMPLNARNIQDLERWENELQIARGNVRAYIDQIKNINHDVNNLHKSLKATRDQRFSRVESGSKTFAGLIRELQDEKKRAALEREAELMRMAAEKEAKRLSEYHEYGGGTGIDIPLLNSDTYNRRKEDDES